MRRRRYWTEKEIQLLSDLYPNTQTKKIADQLGRTLTTVYQKADRLGLKKSEEYLAGPEACRLRRGDNIGAAYRFKAGQTPANKGLRRPGWAPGRMKETQFKKGQRTGKAAENWMPIGSIRVDAEGYLRIKVREGEYGKEATGFGNTKIWPLLARHVWEQHNGPIPPEHVVAFRDRDRSNCAIENLELVSRADLARRNSMWNPDRYPRELAEAIQLSGALKRKLRRVYGKEQAD